MGEILQQEIWPIAFFIHSFPQSMIDGLAYDREMCTIVKSIKKWSHYLMGYKFTVLTNHATLYQLFVGSCT